MKNVLILSTLVAILMIGCDGSCCIDDKPSQNQENGLRVEGSVIKPVVNLDIPETELNRVSQTELPLDGAEFSSDKDGEVTEYMWSFKQPNGTQIKYTIQNPVFNFPTIGNYEICLKVKDDDNQMSNLSCRNIIVEDQPVYLKPEVVLTILDPVSNKPLEPKENIVLTAGKRIIFDAEQSYDPDALDSNKIAAYHWKVVEYRKDAKGYFYKVHYCNWPNPQNLPEFRDHSSCMAQEADSNGVAYAKIPYRIHGGEIHRTVELWIEDQDAIEGNNESSRKVFEYDTNLYNNENLGNIPLHPARRAQL